MKLQPRNGVEALKPEVMEILARRAERLRKQQKDEEEETVEWVAEFAVGAERYAVPLESMRACVPLKMVSPVPLAPPHIIGVLRFQGQIIPAMSLASLIGVRGWREDPTVLLVIDAGGGHLVALDCEEIPRPLALAVKLIEVARSQQVGEGTILEVTTRGLKQVRLINLPRLLAKTATTTTGGAS